MLGTGVTDTTENDEIAILQANGKIVIGDVTVTLKIRPATRLVIGFFDADSNAGWFDEICASENCSAIRVVGKSAHLAGVRIGAFLKKLASSAIVTGGFDVTLCGVGEGCVPVFAHGLLFRSPVVVAFDPPDALPAPTSSKLGEFAASVPAGYVFYDPLMMPNLEKTCDFMGKDVHLLKCFASGGDSLSAIGRMKLFQSILPAALRGELDSVFFYDAMRSRKDFRFYRIGIEAALERRGKAYRIPAFRALFRARVVAGTDAGKFARLRTKAEENRPNRPGAWARLRHQRGAFPDWPSAGGNVWMLQKVDNCLRYLSDRWEGVTMGYVERDGVTLAETPDVALGFVGFGDGSQVERPLARRFPWHVLDARLDGTQPAFGPLSEATLSCEQAYALRECLFTIVALVQVQSGITFSEAVRGSAGYNALLARVAAGQEALTHWNKKLSLDRLRLSLLTGAPHATEAAAADHYADVARSLTADLVELTGQHAPPIVVVIPQAGTRNDGTSEVSLAEARLDLDKDSLTTVVPTPAYPWPLMEGTPATASPEAALVMDELSALAVRERQNGRPWHCPALQIAKVEDRTVLAQFSSMNGLALEDGPHGFHLIGSTEPPAITRVEVVSEGEIRLELDTEVNAEGLQLAYAWGHQSSALGADRSANHGSLRDKWQHRSWAAPGQTLRRFALPGRVPLRVAR